MDKEQVIEIVKEYKKAVLKQISDAKVYLYGSYSIGTAHPESDIDVAVVVPAIIQVVSDGIKTKNNVIVLSANDIVFRFRRHPATFYSAPNWYLKQANRQFISPFSPPKPPNFTPNTGFSPHSPHFGHIFRTAWHDAVLLRRFYAGCETA